MSYRVTLGLLIVLALLGGAVYYSERNPATPTPAGGAAQSPPVPVWSLVEGDVTGLTVTADGKTVAVVRAAEGKWALTAPEAGEADGSRLDLLVGRLATLSASRTIDEPASFAEYGLEKPVAEARITLRSGETKTLLVGDGTPDKAASYVRLPDGADVLIIPGTLGSELSRLVSAPPKAQPTPTVAGTPAP